MMYAARGGHLPVVQVLLAHGADVLHKAEVSHTQQWYVHTHNLIQHSTYVLIMYTGFSHCPSPCCLWWIP